jgi:hypothetical protein
MSNPFLLEQTKLKYSPDFICPYCKQGYLLREWRTEYGYPLDDVFTIDCNCGEHFLIRTRVIVKYKVLD